METRQLVSPEFGIRLPSGIIVTGPDWASHADVVDSYHGFGTDRVYGQLVFRTDDNPHEWKEA